MSHNWYEIYVITRQAQKDLHRRADQARLAEAARKRRKEERKRSGDRHAGRQARETGSDGLWPASAT
jgi:hypothetical protein